MADRTDLPKAVAQMKAQVTAAKFPQKLVQTLVDHEMTLETFDTMHEDHWAMLGLNVGWTVRLQGWNRDRIESKPEPTPKIGGITADHWMAYVIGLALITPPVLIAFSKDVDDNRDTKRFFPWLFFAVVCPLIIFLILFTVLTNIARMHIGMDPLKERSPKVGRSVRGGREEIIACGDRAIASQEASVSRVVTTRTKEEEA